ncbi:hypothetical protein KPP03845_200061 (plasmid) [Streptomyces xanthophaeus]|uniref:hypothetical protein n=1 Tax=Streptomyces xanthophaeus TaxID=67385 RepID=UPI00233ED659|nr:hypothetical protein [Streptomyces xanthophaeus]WCD91100.1 hypothetical protein KPP03845_200061 [Streptomyces xanthophaeus]
MPDISSPPRLNTALTQAVSPYLPYETDLVFELPDPAKLTRPTVSMALIETSLTTDPQARPDQRSAYIGALDYVITYWRPVAERDRGSFLDGSVLLPLLNGLLRAQPLQGIANSTTLVLSSEDLSPRAASRLFQEAGVDSVAPCLRVRITAPIDQLGLAEERDVSAEVSERLHTMGLVLTATDRQRAAEYLQEHPDATGERLIGFLTSDR